MEIVEKTAFKVVGIKVTADWEKLHIEMPKAWRRFISKIEDIPQRKTDVMMDISLEKSGHLYTQLICVEVNRYEPTPEGMIGLHIPAQKYIHHQHAGSVYDIAASFGKMYQWAKTNGYRAGDFKLDMGYLADGSEDTHELHIKIVP